jgi:hypothetical protein
MGQFMFMRRLCHGAFYLFAVTLPTCQWVGPIGTAYCLYGFIPFQIIGAFQSPVLDKENQ